jgi:hypothetical protein
MAVRETPVLLPRKIICFQLLKAWWLLYVPSNLELKILHSLHMLHLRILYGPQNSITSPSSESTLLSSAPPFPKEYSFMEGAPTSPVCPYGTRNMWV